MGVVALHVRTRRPLVRERERAGTIEENVIYGWRVSDEVIFAATEGSSSFPRITARSLHGRFESCAGGFVAFEVF